MQEVEKNYKEFILKFIGWYVERLLIAVIKENVILMRWYNLLTVAVVGWRWLFLRKCV